MPDLSSTFDRVEVLGIPVDVATREAIASWLRAQVMTSEGCAHVVTLNPEYVMAARADDGFAQALRDADLVTIDGTGVAVAVRLLAPGATADRVTGVDIVGMMSAMSVETSAGVFLLGAGPGVANRAAEALRAAYPGARIAGTWDAGSPAPADDAETQERIAASGARVLFVAYGAPGQIHWIDRNREALALSGIRVVAGIGGALDFVSGTVPRAPEAVRRLGLEWAYRLAREPWRWRRQLVLPVFAVLVLRDVARARFLR